EPCELFGRAPEYSVKERGGVGIQRSLCSRFRPIRGLGLLRSLDRVKGFPIQGLSTILMNGEKATHLGFVKLHLESSLLRSGLLGHSSLLAQQRAMRAILLP